MTQRELRIQYMRHVAATNDFFVVTTENFRARPDMAEKMLKDLLRCIQDPVYRQTALRDPRNAETVCRAAFWAAMRIVEPLIEPRDDASEEERS